jgi:hypothetical protein
MIRYNIKVGDKTTSGAIVLEGIDSMVHHGTQLSFLGAAIYCPACKSAGVVVGRGPRWPGSWMGKEPALDNDLGLCKCEPTPFLIASQHDMSESFLASDLASMGFAPRYSPPPDATSSAAFDDRYVLKDRDGKPLANTAYAIKRESGDHEYGETDRSGHTHLLSHAASAENINIYIAG